MHERYGMHYHRIRKVPRVVGIGLGVLKEIGQQGVESLLVLHAERLVHALCADEIGFFQWEGVESVLHLGLGGQVGNEGGRRRERVGV